MSSRRVLSFHSAGASCLVCGDGVGTPLSQQPSQKICEHLRTYTFLRVYAQTFTDEYIDGYVYICVVKHTMNMCIYIGIYLCIHIRVHILYVYVYKDVYIFMHACVLATKPY